MPPPLASADLRVHGKSQARSARFPTSWVPAIGLATMLATISCACLLHFDCPANLPVLSHAAEYSPEYYIFAIGMNCTAYCMYISTQRFSNVLCRRLTKFRGVLPRLYRGVAIVTTMALVVLSICDSIRFPDAHVVSTIVFFVFAWVKIALAHIGRHNLEPFHGAQSPNVDAIIGSWLIGVGLASSFTFGCVYLARRHFATKSFAFGIAFESSSELVAILCQLLYMGTLPVDSVVDASSIKATSKAHRN
ncbi:hypothetical protein H310_01024 [Aphanomyces invadans]|uniref:CWH43-like N-terminal domain-containing protein n=1 Tax=Aphanomyces invadans TaxID=157072 RepID=A0A024US62_9STRA|nr:hypothetical protein H310_01024 [Aphanomyces invadans]ETW08443.1 hypothetical protein H310_01024 [Aphanomyces invadans]|eukprot:XP_008862248.1 hypothetical protein H310_01024 [Aphanomyces invadans]